jgi:DNA modification methylase
MSDDYYNETETGTRIVDEVPYDVPSFGVIDCARADVTDIGECNPRSADPSMLENGFANAQRIVIGNATLYCGDAFDVLPQLASDFIDSAVTDPPYGIDFMGKHWDADVPSSCLWKLVLRTLKPGAHLLSFSGARTYHRVATSIEDAGFRIRDQIMWIFGSGMPKSHNMAKAIQALKTTGSAAPMGQRKAAMGDTYCLTDGAGKPGYGNGGNFFGPLAHQNGRRTPELPVNDNDAVEWEGWGTGLKPAHEPICMARKPFRGSCTANVLKYATGAINIDACRIAGNDNASAGSRKGSVSHDSARSGCGGELLGVERKGEALGRWPANVLHDGSDEVLALFPDVRTGKGTRNARQRNRIYTGNFAGKASPTELNQNGGDSGSAARFFYCPKASKMDREQGTPQSNKHPTVKPTQLMAYLCRLVTPPRGTLLDCFMGSGSTGKAAVQQGFRFIGIERDPEHFRVACARIADAQGIRLKADWAGLLEG